MKDDRKMYVIYYEGSEIYPPHWEITIFKPEDAEEFVRLFIGKAEDALGRCDIHAACDMMKIVHDMIDPSPELEARISDRK